MDIDETAEQPLTPMNILARKYKQVTTADLPPGTGDMLKTMAYHTPYELKEFLTDAGFPYDLIEMGE